MGHLVAAGKASERTNANDIESDDDDASDSEGGSLGAKKDRLFSRLSLTELSAENIMEASELDA